MKNQKTPVILVMLNLILTTNIFFSEYVYLSRYRIFSWYENSGTQFLAILIISTPIFLLLIITYHFLGKKNMVRDLNKKLPTISLLVFLIPIMMDLSLSDLFLTIGALLGFILCLVSLIILFKSCNKFLKNN